MSPVWILLTLLPILGGAQRFNCKGRILGAYYADAKSGCKAFHVCVRVAGGGIRDFRFFCPPGTLFHQEAQTCTDWGDDDPLACPADIYDGQFDLYKIGSGFDTKKLSSQGNRDDEAEFGLQRAETGDRRSQNNVAANRPDTDLRAAHSSDFFSGHRDRGLDENVPASQPQSPAPSLSTSQSPFHSRQSFRRPSTQRTFSTTQNSSPASSTPPSAPPAPPNRPQYDTNTKRKLVRKRPIYVSNKSVISTSAPNAITQENYPQGQKQAQQNYNTQNYNTQQNYNQKQNFKNQNNYRRGPTQARPSTTTTTTTTPDVPPQYREYKDEYVEVSRVTPKQSRYYSSSTSQPQTTSAQRYNKKDGLTELFNYDAQSTPGLNENEPFKVRHSFNVANPSRDPEFARSNNENYNNFKEYSTTIDYSVSTRGFPTTTPAYKNYNSVSYEPEKNNFLSYSKNNHFNNHPTTSAAPNPIYTTAHPEPPANLNTVAYNTNIGFNAQSNNYAESDEDDGQYHPPEGEDDGQYKPEIYDRELLAGAHSLNIAASGNRLPEERKTYSKTRFSPKNSGQTIAPRPFKPAPTTAQPTTIAPEILYTTTLSPQTTYTQRTFDYFQTYTTTSRPADFLLGQTFAPTNEVPVKPTTTLIPRATETKPPRPTSHAPVHPTQSQTVPPRPTTRLTSHAPTFPSKPQTAPPRPTTRPPNFAFPANKKEDTSYDYAYYDSDPGFVEYDHIEEFGKTNKKRS